MKIKITQLQFILFFCLKSSFVLSSSGTSLLEQLQDLNKFWRTNEISHPKLNSNIEFKNDAELIQVHLSIVEQELRSRNTDHLTLSQIENRNTCLNYLHAYMLRASFPQNTFHTNRTPYFIDIYGTACAVGQLIIESGYKDFATRISEENNFDYIHQLNSKYPDLQVWAIDHGFTLDELAWIQPAYQICDTACVQTLSIYTAAGQSPYSYQWSDGQTTSSAYGLCPGVYYECTIIDGNGDTIAPADCNIYFQAGMVINSNAVTIPVANPVFFEHQATPDNGTCNGSAEVFVTRGVSPFTYYWHPGGQTTQGISGLCHGTYIVTVMDMNNCLRTDSITVDFSTGIRDIDKNAFSLYPNPTAGKLTIKLNNSSKSGVSGILFNSTGEKVRLFSLTDRETLLDISHLEAGIYRISIFGADGISSQTFVKQE